MKKSILVTCIFLGAFSLYSTEKGVIDLSSCNCFESNVPVRLDGLWEFRWNELLEPGDSRWNTTPDKTRYYPVPLFWTSYEGENFSIVGQGTYRLIIKISGDSHYYGIKLPEIFSEYKLWINDDLIDERWADNGGRNLFLRPSSFVIHSDSDTLELILQVRNHSHSNAGIGQSIMFGSARSIQRSHIISISLDVILIAICLFAGMYHTIIFIFRREEKELLFFGLFCIILALRTFSTGSTLMMQAFPSLTFLLGSRIATVFIPLSVIGFHGFSYYFFRKYTPVKSCLVLTGIHFFYFILVLTTTSLFYSRVYTWYLLIIILSCIFIIGVDIYAIIKRQNFSVIFFTGFLILIVGIVNDMLHYLQIIITGYYLSAFFAGFILLESLMLSIKFSQEYKKVNELSLRLDKAVNTANLDPLTGIYNRRYLAIAGNKELEIFKRYGHQFSLVMIDIDNFKQINDGYGHDAGDQVIVKLASLLLIHIRGGDTAVRYGGDEFVILLPQTGINEAQLVAEKIRAVVEDTAVSLKNEKNIHFTISMGIGGSENKQLSFDEIMKQADKMLYKSKKSGRNTVSSCL